MRELGRRGPVPDLVDFDALLREAGLADLLRTVLERLADAYQHPVDIEFTVNPDRDGGVVLNLVQCRPLQTRGVGGTIGVPAVEASRCLLTTHGNFMGATCDCRSNGSCWCGRTPTCPSANRTATR